jgi:DNA-binding NtrC family response regulator
VQALEGYDWPGNVRELRNAVERAAALCHGPEVFPEDLSDEVRRSGGQVIAGTIHPAEPAEPRPAASTLSEYLAEAEARRIVEALGKHGNNRLRAAAELGLSRMGLYKKLYRLGLLERPRKVP